MSSFFLRITQYQADAQHARTLISINTRTQTLPLWALPKNDWAGRSRDSRSHHRRLAVDGDVATTESIAPLNPRINLGKCEYPCKNLTKISSRHRCQVHQLFLVYKSDTSYMYWPFCSKRNVYNERHSSNFRFIALFSWIKHLKVTSCSTLKGTTLSKNIWNLAFTNVSRNTYLQILHSRLVRFLMIICSSISLTDTSMEPVVIDARLTISIVVVETSSFFLDT
jgi:hypothetical protein